MCGIAGIIRSKNSPADLTEKIFAMTEAVRHRGPDGEGFMFSDFHRAETISSNRTTPEKDLPFLNWNKTRTIDSPFLAFGHRRLSILDLSECGHQPMCDRNSEIWITYNGEIYNYLELRTELIAEGFTFFSQSDTEVIIAAYQHWGQDCVKKFNGMWSFCIYDVRKKICFASRDRLGVKPFYYVADQKYFAFASEQKAFVKAGLIEGTSDQQNIAAYLLRGAMENSENNFFSGVRELMPGHNLVYDPDTNKVTTRQFFSLREIVNRHNDSVSENELVGQIAGAIEDAVRLRLRSDVEVGTCLSGGLDSSTLAITMAAMLDRPVSCFTSVFPGTPFNEENYADLVAGKIGARHYKIEPTIDDFWKEADDLIYSQDVPIWSTSTFAQHKVMQLASRHGVKVVLDGQGADELFAGYHHHFVAKWNNLLSRGKWFALIGDLQRSERSIQRPVSLYVKEKIKSVADLRQHQYSKFLSSDFIRNSRAANPVLYHNDVNEQLLEDTGAVRLKAFLKCEDRCGMWHGVESRTPFSDDIHLMSLLFSFHGNKKIQKGVSKFLLREAMKKKLPPEIYNRTDKVGFETPMKKWVTASREKMTKEILAAEFSFVKKEGLQKADLENRQQLDLFFKLFVLSRWQKLFAA